MKKNWGIILASLGIIIISGIIYGITLSPTVSWIDSGELAIDCATLGIPHPTGYPLYTLIGRVFSLIFCSNIIKGLNFLSLLFITFSNLFLFFILLELVQILSLFKNKNLSVFLSGAATLVFAFTPTLWEQATSNEVYALNILFASALLFLVFLWHKTKFIQKEKGKSEKLFCLLVFLYALSFGNHVSIVLLLPGLLFFLLVFLGKSFFQPKRLFLGLALFLLGLTIYLYLPLRSSQNPLMDWGHPAFWGNFKRQVTGWQYQVWMFSESSAILKENFRYYLNLFHQQFSFPLIFLGVLGAGSLFFKNKKVFFFLFLIFVCDVFYGINYTIKDIDSYFLFSFLVFSLWLGIGFFQFFQLLSRWLEKLKVSRIWKARSIIYLSIFFLIFPLLTVLKNFATQNKSKNHFAYDYAKNILRSVKKDAIILTNVWDHYSPWLYLRFGENLRPDVQFIDQELCRRSWYFNFLKKNYPSLYSLSEKEIEEFKEAVYPFERGLYFESDFIEGKYQKMLSSFYEKNYAEKPLYDALIKQSPVAPQFIRFPEGLAFRLHLNVENYPFEFPQFDLRGVFDAKIFKDERTKTWISYYSTMIKKRIDYLSYFKENELAPILYKRYENLLMAY
jgi:hypothetical protein